MKNIFENIDNSADLKTILLDAKEYGFDFGDVHGVEKRYLENIIMMANTHHIEVNPKGLIEKYFTGSYSVFKAEMQNYFGQFGVQDKIKELLGKVNVAWSRINYKKNVAEEYKKLTSKGYIDLGLEKREHELVWFIVYDFTAKTLKLDINPNNHWEFNKMIGLLGYDFQIPYFSEFSAPKVWETEDFKIYKNHTVEIKNEKLIKELKALLIEKYKSSKHATAVIKV